MPVGEVAVAGAEDWSAFLAWAAAEGWRVPQREVELLQGRRLGRALALQVAGCCGGFVSCVRHGSSGWIGNLIVPAALRGSGYGQRLFVAALQALAVDGAERVWLTASQLGRPLYERHGFVAVGNVRRWVRAAQPVPPSVTALESASGQASPWRNDALAWGEARTALLGLLGEKGRWRAAGDATALLQFGRDVQVLGPWHRGREPLEDAHALLSGLLAVADPQVEIACDLVGEAPEATALAACGFRAVGETVLMVRGGIGRAHLPALVALATLGSGG